VPKSQQASYLTHLHDRLLLCRELLAQSGSIFVQISDENLHHVREVMDEVFEARNFVSLISFKKTGGLDAGRLSTVCDYILWYAKDLEKLKYRQLFLDRSDTQAGLSAFKYYFDSTGEIVTIKFDDSGNPVDLPLSADLFQTMALTSQGASQNSQQVFKFNGKEYRVPANKHWRFSLEGLERLAELDRIITVGNNIRAVSYLKDFPLAYLNNVWTDTGAGSFLEPQMYVVQTVTKVISRCLLMTTDPGDLVLDPTCGSGTTAYIAERWGRRWVTIDISRVPLALGRQRLLTATFPYYQLKEESRGPAGGFVYVRKQNNKREEVGGIVPHITLKSIANNEPPEEEVLVDRPEEDKKVTRVTGPFTVEATIPTPIDWEGDGIEDSGAVTLEEHGSLVDRMLEVLRKSPVLHLGDGKTVTLKNIRPPAKTLSLSAEAVVMNPHPSPLPEGEGDQAVALVFGPENGAISEKLVYEAAREAHAKSYSHLYVIGFAIQPNARRLVEDSDAAVGIPSTYVQATPDLMMGDLLKNMRSSQLFSVCGLPEVKLHRLKPKSPDDPVMYLAELLGLDVFDPTTMETDHRGGDDVPAWFLDTDYNGLCFHVTQAFFPRTNAWDNLKRALKGLYEDTLWDHLAGTKSAPFEAGEHGQIAVKVIDDRGNELLVVKNLKEAIG
jgi:adenine-specific DNA-methyltransferase